jgi:hypothetical protein
VVCLWGKLKLALNPAPFWPGRPLLFQGELQGVVKKIWQLWIFFKRKLFFVGMTANDSNAGVPEDGNNQNSNKREKDFELFQKAIRDLEEVIIEFQYNRRFDMLTNCMNALGPLAKTFPLSEQLDKVIDEMFTLHLELEGSECREFELLPSLYAAVDQFQTSGNDYFTDRKETEASISLRGCLQQLLDTDE